MVSGDLAKSTLMRTVTRKNCEKIEDKCGP